MEQTALDVQNGTEKKKTTEIAIFAGGCFWCLEAAFDGVKGVLAVESGYANGSTKNPTYEQVCTGKTGFAEAVHITYDAGVISYHDLLEMFFAIHDPTSLNRQGADVGEQYRSAIFALNISQLEQARQFVAARMLKGVFHKPVVTVIELLKNYYPAEDEHQRYFEKHPGQGYCQVVVGPKVDKFRKTFASKLRG